MSILCGSFALYEHSPRLNRGYRPPTSGSALETCSSSFLFRDSGLFGLRTRREVELDLPLTVQDEARAKRFAGTRTEAGDDLLRPAFLDQLAGQLRREGAAGDALPDDEAAAGLLAALPARAAVRL